MAQLQVQTINSVLTPPPSLSDALTQNGLTSLVGAVAALNMPTLLPTLANTPGLTIFAPSNQAFAAIASTIGTLNATTIQNVLLNHILNGTVAYSATFSNNEMVTSASGEPLTIGLANGTATVSTGNVTAHITKADILIENGVMFVFFLLDLKL